MNYGVGTNMATRVLDFADGFSSESSPTVVGLILPATNITFDNTNTNFDATDVQALGEELDVALNLEVKDFIDAPNGPLLDTSSTNIPASASTPLTIVASLAADVRKVRSVDDVGAFIGLYSDPAGTPVLQGILGPGGSELEVSIPAATVLGLRHMENSVLSTGKISVTFLG